MNSESKDLDPRSQNNGQPGEILNRQVYYDGDIIVHQGDDGNRAFYIEKGTVAIIIKDGTKELKVTELSAGDLFGEMALINNAPRSASVQALSETVVTTISRDEVEGRIKGIDDKAVRALINVLARRLRSTTKGQMEHFKNTSNFFDQMSDMVERISEDIPEEKREKFCADVEPLLGSLQKVLEKYQK